MSRFKRGRPSPSMIVAGTALVVALAGTAIAGPLATNSALSKREKKQVRKIATDQVNALASGLTVANAERVDGANASDLRTSSAFNQDTNDLALPNLDTNVVSTTITTHHAGGILATGSAELVGATGGEVGACSIVLAGKDSADYETTGDDVLDNNQFTISPSFAVTRPAGTYTAAVQCRAEAGTVSKDDAAINVYGLGP